MSGSKIGNELEVTPKGKPKTRTLNDFKVIICYMVHSPWNTLIKVVGVSQKVFFEIWETSRVFLMQIRFSYTFEHRTNVFVIVKCVASRCMALFSPEFIKIVHFSKCWHFSGVEIIGVESSYFDKKCTLTVSFPELDNYFGANFN